MRFSTLARRFTATALVAGLLGAGLTTPASGSVPAAMVATPAAPAGALTAITPGLKGFDSLNVETPDQIECLRAAGYSYDMVNTNGNTWQDEYNAAAAAGLEVVLFQGYDPDAWADPSAAAARATISKDKAAGAGYPKGGQIFLNLEDNVGRGVTAADMIKWINTWTTVIRNAGYSPGIYVGAPQLLTAGQIDALPGVVFWKSVSGSAPQAARGFVAAQPVFETPACGIYRGIDVDVAGRDSKGVHLIGAAFPKSATTPTTPGAFVSMNPTRLLDTRVRFGAVGPIAGRKQIDAQITNAAIPAGQAAAVVLNVTVVNPAAAGYLSVFPTQTGEASVSSLNFTAHQTVANLVTVRLGTGGKVSLFNGAGLPTDVIADVAGYYRTQTTKPGAPGTFVPVKPARLLDTRPAGVDKRATAQVATANRTGLPASGYDSVVLNVTAVAPTQPGYLTAFATGAQLPPASNLNFSAGRTAPNMATVKVGTTGNVGKVSLYNGSEGRINLLADVAGYYYAGTRTAAGAFAPLSTPARILDTRSKVGSTGKAPSSGALALQVRGRGGVPATATAVVLDVTVVNQTAAGYLTVFPSDRSAPNASTINFVPRVTIANQVLVPIGADGRIVLYNQSAAPTDLLADVAGYILG